MELEELKKAVSTLAKEDRRKLALYILELEKQHVQDTVSPQIAEDVEAFSRVVHDTINKVKRHIKENW